MRELILRLMLFVCCLAVTSCAHDPKYFLSIAPAPSSTAPLSPYTCNIYLEKVVEDVLANKDASVTIDDIERLKFDVSSPSGGKNIWTIRLFEIKLEHELDRVIQSQDASCQGNDKSSFRKWITTYSLNGTDPDQDLSRFQEYLESVERISDLLKDYSVLAEKNAVFESNIKYKSQWCGDPKIQECKDADWPLYKIVSKKNKKFGDEKDKFGHEKEFDDLIKDRLQQALGSNTKDQPKRFYILGYELPWDKQQTEIRYGLSFYFEEREQAQAHPKHFENRKFLHFIGYREIYANEATPLPYESPTFKGMSREEQISKARTPYKALWHATGYPIAVVIGIKNAVFETAKIPLSWIAGLVGGRDSVYLYPAENLVNAYKALYVETTSLPSYGFFPAGFHALLSEVPLVGQIFQINTGPDHEDRDLSSPKIGRKIFLSRGIYGGDEAGQDTGLWSAHAQKAYPAYDVYAPPYKHGTAIDVVWSMFNLSHGPAYAEAKYVMEKAGPYDHLYLSGHSGGVQRSASASRILANHGYSVVKVLGIAGPSIGQAYVDTRYGNPFQIFLNTQTGANEDIVGKIGLVAHSFSTLMQYGVITPLKFTAGILTRPIPDLQRCTYQFFDHMGFSNAVITEVLRKRTTLHQTPLRLSLNEPIVFDAYIRSEFETAFREDLTRPSDSSFPEFKFARDGEAADLTDLLGTSVKSSKGCTLFEHRSGAVFEWVH